MRAMDMDAPPEPAMPPNDPHRSPFGGWTQLTSHDGTVIRVEAEHPHLSILAGSARVNLPYPSSGYGGHEILLSPHETYLVLWLYSGQTEVGYELFQFRPLRHVGSFPYDFGEGVGPLFSSDEDLLALAWTTNAFLDVDDAPADDDGNTLSETIVEWAIVRVQALPDGPATTCRIAVRRPPGSPLEGENRYYPLLLEVNQHEAHLLTEWGAEVHLPLPLPESVTIDGPAYSPAGDPG